MRPDDVCQRCHHIRDYHEETLLGIQCRGTDWWQRGVCQCDGFLERITEVDNGPIPSGDLPYQSHSDTSRAAAVEIEPSAATLRGQVLAHIRKCGYDGATDDESQVDLGMNPSTQRPRRIELWRAGFIVDSGRRRMTRGNRMAVVWVSSDKAGDLPKVQTSDLSPGSVVRRQVTR